MALLGPLTGLVVNAGCFALGSVIIGLALPRGMGHASQEIPSQAGTGPGYWRRFGEGFTFLRSQPLLLTVIVMVAITNLLDAAFAAVLMPVWARVRQRADRYRPDRQRAGSAAVGGSLIAAMAAHRLRRRVVFFTGFLLAGAPRFLILASHAPMGVVLAVFAASGFGAGFLNPVLGAILFERVPRRMLGRVSALGDSLAWAGIPLGGLIAGAAVASVGLVPVLLAGGLSYFLTTNLTGLRPEWREMDRVGGGGAPKGQPEEDAQSTSANLGT